MRNLKFLFTYNRLFKHKEVVSNLHVCSNGLGIMRPSYTFHFSTRILSSIHTKDFKFFFAYYMSRCQTINFQLPLMSKCLVQHISTKVSFKITTRKWHVYIDLGWTWTWNQCLYLGIRNNDRTKMIVLPSFHLATRLN